MILGIDPSLTGTGVCLIDEAAQIHRLATLRPPDTLDRIQRLVWIRNQVQAFYNLAQVAFIEHYSFGSRNQLPYLGELGGLLRVSMYGFLPFYEIAPSTMKKYVCGKGNVKKNVVLEQCFRRYNVGSETLTDDNQVDAYCLCMLGRHFIAWRTEEKVDCTKNELAVFKKIGEPMGRLPVRFAAVQA